MSKKNVLFSNTNNKNNSEEQKLVKSHLNKFDNLLFLQTFNLIFVHQIQMERLFSF